MATTRDRRAKVLASTTVNGIDFVEVANQAQTQLRVHFLNAVTVTSRGMISQIYRQQGSSTPGLVASATSQRVFQRNMPSLGNSRPSLESTRTVLRETPLGIVSVRLR